MPSGSLSKTSGHTREPEAVADGVDLCNTRPLRIRWLLRATNKSHTSHQNQEITFHQEDTLSKVMTPTLRCSYEDNIPYVGR